MVFAAKFNACAKHPICTVIIPASKPSCAALTSLAALSVVN